ncbi:MAG TPA: DUF2795 domain-containing protein [Yaniella sp.]
MTKRDDLRAAKALQGADFPKTKEELLHYAQTRSADTKTLDALHGLPDQQFNNMDEVIEAVPQEPEGVDQPGGTAR